MSKTDGKELINSMADAFSAEELCLMSLQGVIAAEISIKRQEMKMNQKQFSEFMGVSQGLVSKWESGESNFTLSTLVNIASKLNIEIQCPFVTTPAPVYYDLNRSNVIQLHNSGWTSIKSKSIGYETAEDDLMEM